MSQENVEVVRRGFTAITLLDADAMLEFMDPTIEFRPRFQLMLGGEEAVYRGHSGVREAFRDVYAALDWIFSAPDYVRQFNSKAKAGRAGSARSSASRKAASPAPAAPG